MINTFSKKKIDVSIFKIFFLFIFLRKKNQEQFVIIIILLLLFFKKIKKKPNIKASIKIKIKNPGERFCHLCAQLRRATWKAKAEGQSS